MLKAAAFRKVAKAGRAFWGFGEVRCAIREHMSSVEMEALALAIP
jgi:hypothetical protein